jgi:signal transduction histidine kinase/CheY-like chemotaxis protein
VELRKARRAMLEKETRYLRLGNGDAERLEVEQIRAHSAEIAILSFQLAESLRAGDRAGAGQRLALVEELGRRMERRFDALDAIQLEKLRALLAEVGGASDEGRLAVYTLTAGLGVILCVFLYLLRLWVVRPLRALEAAAEAVRRGDLSARAPVLQEDEIGRLARQFNVMAASLADSHADLERRVAERTTELAEMQVRLVEAARMSAIGQLVGGVAHELNHPLTAIVGIAELQRLEIERAGGDPERRRAIEDIAGAADRCRRIVANLLLFARRQEPRLEPVRLNEVVERTLRLRDYELETRNVSIVRRYDPADPVLAADPHKLQQVILNLVNNARDAVLEKGSAGPIEVVTKETADGAELEVRDDGAGIADASRLFEPFYTTKDVGKGTGLGLAVCWGIVREHGGTIHAENRPGGGAVFRVLLPRGEPAAMERSEPSQRAGPVQAAGKRALVVDDEQQLIRLQISFLESLGMDAVGVASGEDAIRYLSENQVDLVVSDARMPGAFDGMMLYDWIGKNRPALTKRFLLVSGDLVALSDGDPQGPHVQRLQKPFKLVEYVRAVERVMDA